MDAIVVDVGSDRHSVYIPSNLLQVLPGNRYRHLLIDQQQSAMIKVACRPAFQERQPSERSNKSLITDVGLPLLGIGWYLAPNGPVSEPIFVETNLPLVLMYLPGTMFRSSC